LTRTTGLGNIFAGASLVETPEVFCMRPLVFLVGDKKELCRTIGDLLRESYEMLEAGTAVEAVDVCRKHYIDCIIIDQVLPDMDGVEVLKALKMSGCSAQMILLTTLDGGQPALEAMKHGAYGVLVKPVNRTEVTIMVERAVEKRHLEQENCCLSEFVLTTSRGAIVGESAAIAGVRSLISNVASADTPVLITGEMGTGKGLVARAIHAGGNRAARPFVTFDCSRPDSPDLDLELFGCVKSFEGGGGEDRMGRLLCASGGTLFLEAIEWLSPRLQDLLMKAIQDKSFNRLGYSKPHPLTARLISGSGMDLKEAVGRGTFRQDLFWGLGVVSVHLIPLRERKEDVRAMVTHFLGRDARKFGRTGVSVSDEVIRVLEAYPWPGNVGELKDMCRHLLRTCDGAAIGKDDLPIEMVLSAEMAGPERRGEAGEGDEGVLRHARQQFERLFIKRVLEEHGGNQARAARALGVHRNTLINKMNELKLREGLGKSRRRWFEAETL